MIDPVALRKVLQDWVVAASGLDDDRVIWAGQNGPRPETPYVELRVLRLRRVGQDGVFVEDNPSPGAGTEILHIARGVRELQLVVTCFGGGHTVPQFVLEDVVSRVRLPSVSDPLVAAGVGVARFDPILAVDGALGETLFESRAILNAYLFLAQEVTEEGTYIEFVELNRLEPDPDAVVWVPEEPPP